MRAAFETRQACCPTSPSPPLALNCSRSGSTLYISVPAANADAVKGQTITGISDQKLMSTSNPIIWENPTYQTVLTSGGADYLHAYISLTWADAPKPGLGCCRKP